MSEHETYQGLDVLDYWNKQVAQQPQATAVVCGAVQLSFQELEQFSNQAAHGLRQQGVLPGEPVALMLNKDARALIWILALWKLGALYVPIDPQAPRGKVARIFEVCPMRWGILDGKQTAREPFEDLNVRVWDVDAMELAAYSSRGLADPVGRQQLAYMIFTSGSTGLPKGVAISRESLSQFVGWTQHALGVEAGMSALNIADLSFDQSVMDIAFLLGAGVALHLYAQHKDPLSIAAYIKENVINVLSTVPTVFGLFFDEQFELTTEDFRSLRKVFIGGAACPPPYVSAFGRLMPQADVYNMYGPTEVTVYCMFHAFTRNELANGVQTVELGRALPGHEVWLVDEQGKPVEGRGELVVKGPQVMAGYWGNPGQTVQVLVDASDGLKGYRTGDIVTRTEAGKFIFTGRQNETIKSAGYRIDLGEVEAAVMSCSGVVHAAAIAVPDALLENIVHVFVSRSSAAFPNEHDLRAHCTQVIPGYMQPGHVHFLQNLPLNASGKIDKRRLAEQLAAA